MPQMQMFSGKSRTPQRLVIMVDNDVEVPDSAVLTCYVKNQAGAVLGSSSARLTGLELDFVKDIIGATVEAYQWGDGPMAASRALYNTSRDARRRVKELQRRPRGEY